MEANAGEFICGMIGVSQQILTEHSPEAGSSADPTTCAGRAKSELPATNTQAVGQAVVCEPGGPPSVTGSRIQPRTLDRGAWK